MAKIEDDRIVKKIDFFRHILVIICVYTYQAQSGVRLGARGKQREKTVLIRLSCRYKCLAES